MTHRIVIADDDATIVRLVSLRLALEDYEVLSAPNGRAALELIRTAEPAMAILDMNMPEYDGLAVLGEIKASPATRSLPVLMLTGERSAETVRGAMQAGANDYIVKPFDPDRLSDRVGRLVAGSTMVWPAPAASEPMWEL